MKKLISKMNMRAVGMLLILLTMAAQTARADNHVSVDCSYWYNGTNGWGYYQGEIGGKAIASINNGTTSISSNDGVAAGTEVTLTATPASGYRFVEWEDAGGVTLANQYSATTTFTMPNNRVQIYASFVPSNMFYVSTSVTGLGTVEVSLDNSRWDNSYVAVPGTKVYYRFTPNSGYELLSHSISSGGNAVATDNTDNSFVMPDGDVTITADFSALYVTMIPAQGGGTYRVVDGTKLYVTPATGYYVNKVTWYDADPNGGGEINSVVLDNSMGYYETPNPNGFIVVTFHKYSDYDGVRVTFNMKSHGTAPAAQDLHLGDKVTRPDDPTAEGYVFLGWYKNSSCTNPYDFDTVLDNTLKYDTSNDRYTLTLYAKWAVGGSCGKGHGSDVYWYVSKSAGSSKYDVLTIFGSGEMEDYKNKERPWIDYINQIKTVVVEEGVTTISKYAFYDFVNVTSDITIPASVTSIGLRAFKDVSSNTAAGIHISAAEGSVLTSIDKAFNSANASIDLSRCTNLTAINNENVFREVTHDVTLPSGVTSICQWAFGRYSEYAFLGDHAYVVVPDGKALSVTIDGVTEPVVIEPTDGKADIIGCLYADPANRAASRALTFTQIKKAIYTVTTSASPEEGGAVLVTKTPGSDQSWTNKLDAIDGETIYFKFSSNNGYVFKSYGVETVDGAHVAVTGNSFTMPAADVMVSATFEESRPDAPLIYVTVQNDGHGTASADKTGNITPGTLVTLTATPKEGYVFKEWQVVSGDDNLNLDASRSTTTFYMPDHSVTVKAMFRELLDFTVAFYANNGSETMESVTVKEGATYTIPACTFTNGDMLFAGWAKSANGSVEYLPGNTITLKDNLSLYAKWCPLSGSCGEKVTWAVTKGTGSDNYDVLTISGSGSMADYKSTTSNRAPWYDYRYIIKTIVIDDGVTAIGNYAFYNFVNVSSDITIPASVTSIGNYSFQHVSENTAAGIRITAADESALTSLGESAFNSANACIDLSPCTHLTDISEDYVFRSVTKDVILPSSLTSICEFAFSKYNSGAFLGDHVYVIVPDGKALSVTITLDEGTESVVLEPTDGKADILYCLYADPTVKRTLSRALTLAMVAPAVASVTTEGGVTTEYSSLEQAFEAVQSQDVLTLLADYNVPVDVENGKTGILGVGNIYEQVYLTLDLNGHTLGFPDGGYLNIGTLTDLTVSGGTISGTANCIYNTGTLRLGDCTITATEGVGITGNGELELHALPTFNCKNEDIALAQDKVIYFGNPIVLNAAPTTKIKVSITNPAPYLFSHGFEGQVTVGEKWLDPEDVFTSSQYGDNAVGSMYGEGQYEAGIAGLTEITFPAGKSTYFDERALALYETNDKLKFYTVTDVDETSASVELTEYEGKLFGEHTPLIVCNETGEEITANFIEAFDGPMVSYYSNIAMADLNDLEDLEELYELDERKRVYFGFEGTNEALDEIYTLNGMTYYGFNGTGFVRLSRMGPIAAHRCWLSLGEPQYDEPASARSLTVSWPDGSTTGISEKGVVNSHHAVAADGWYGIDGRKIDGEPVGKGLYIRRNGNKAEKLIIK